MFKIQLVNQFSKFSHWFEIDENHTKEAINILGNFLSVTMQKSYKDIEKQSLEKLVTVQVLESLCLIT